MGAILSCLCNKKDSNKQKDPFETTKETTPRSPLTEDEHAVRESLIPHGGARSPFKPNYQSNSNDNSISQKNQTQTKQIKLYVDPNESRNHISNRQPSVTTIQSMQLLTEDANNPNPSEIKLYVDPNERQSNNDSNVTNVTLKDENKIDDNEENIMINIHGGNTKKEDDEDAMDEELRAMEVEDDEDDENAAPKFEEDDDVRVKIEGCTTW
eukprot:CAMPEP_0201594636 /NCGR_PEP_ID=MMETSP0190_2-20130828/191893_1 /ASSEMBLY_ACC=CAM_ASM_000263 /TAXON_ID=37353 /ORGANISM="Rosalina sp." /LENGTH=210 /DNA_ID=CAMNT_0048054325 /DNA_START=42 /DNA_END=671 /DNA_ORIENTATION=-